MDLLELRQGLLVEGRNATHRGEGVEAGRRRQREQMGHRRSVVTDVDLDLVVGGHHCHCRALPSAIVGMTNTRRGILVLLRGWAPFVGLLVAYELMRDVASALGVPPHNLAPLDRHLFDGYEPVLILRGAAANFADADLLEDAGSLIYAAHFLLPVAIGAWLWSRDREAFGRFGFTLVILCAMAFATYVVAPTSPPWLSQPSSVCPLVVDAI